MSGGLEAHRLNVKKAWKLWDEHPERPETASAMEEACRILAEHLGITTGELRNQLSESRRVGHSPSEALKLVRKVRDGST